MIQKCIQGDPTSKYGYMDSFLNSKFGGGGDETEALNVPNLKDRQKTIFNEAVSLMSIHIIPNIWIYHPAE